MNIFVSYKYWDFSVKRLNGYSGSYPHARDYVDWIEDKISYKSNDTYKGEHDDEDLTGKSDDYIWEKLKDKIFYSSITIVLISPNMKENHKWDKSQWIPWEISYSLRETIRNDQKSRSNAILGIIIPNKNGSYDYYYDKYFFSILEENIKCGYIPLVKWDDFVSSYNSCISKALEAKNDTPRYKIKIEV